jgi:hypothetical protein
MVIEISLILWFYSCKDFIFFGCERGIGKGKLNSSLLQYLNFWNNEQCVYMCIRLYVFSRYVHVPPSFLNLFVYINSSLSSYLHVLV